MSYGAAWKILHSSPNYSPARPSPWTFKLTYLKLFDKIQVILAALRQLLWPLRVPV